MTIYESNYEHDEPRTDQDGEDKKMEDRDIELKLKFREVPYSVETGDAEMISMDFVARGSKNATAVEARRAPSAPAVESDVKGKKRKVEQGDKKTEAEKDSEMDQDEVVLSSEEEEMIAALTAKANAIKMLHSRIQLIITYLEQLPPSIKAGETLANEPLTEGGSYTRPSHSILRSIQALVNRLDLIVPSDIEAFEKEMLREQNDVNLISLLNDVTQSLKEARDVGRKFGVVENSKASSKRLAGDYAGTSGHVFSLAGTGDLVV